MKQSVKITKRARELRRDSTDAESKMWEILRHKRLNGCRFRRQHSIGKYIADFACIQYRLVVECDGGQHAGNPRDVEREAILAAGGWTSLRFWNCDILSNAEGVYATIEARCGTCRERELSPLLS